MTAAERSCDPKRRLTRTEACERVRNIRLMVSHTRRTKPHSIHAYHCPHCGGYHVGHAAAPKKSYYKRKKRIEYYPEQDS